MLGQTEQVHLQEKQSFTISLVSVIYSSEQTEMAFVFVFLQTILLFSGVLPHINRTTWFVNINRVPEQSNHYDISQVKGKEINMCAKRRDWQHTQAQ